MPWLNVLITVITNMCSLTTNILFCHKNDLLNISKWLWAELALPYMGTWPYLEMLNRDVECRYNFTWHVVVNVSPNFSLQGYEGSLLKVTNKNGKNTSVSMDTMGERKSSVILYVGFGVVARSHDKLCRCIHSYVLSSLIYIIRKVLPFWPDCKAIPAYGMLHVVSLSIRLSVWRQHFG